jgi:hypothetical protein
VNWKPGVVEHVCNSATWQEEAGGLRTQVVEHLPSKYKALGLISCSTKKISKMENKSEVNR